MVFSRHPSPLPGTPQTDRQRDADSTLIHDIQGLIDSAEDFLQSTASYNGADIEAARARVVSQLNAARDHARKHRRSKVYRRATEVAQHSGRYVSEHKWQSASVLAVVAALAGGLYAGLRWTNHPTRRR